MRQLVTELGLFKFETAAQEGLIAEEFARKGVNFTPAKKADRITG